MNELKIWFLDVGHGDCAYIQLPNGARMMIDCGCGEDHWPSKMLRYYGITKDGNAVTIPGITKKYGLDELVITHPHGDHISDIAAICDEVGFYLLSGGYRKFIDNLQLDIIDFRKRGQDAAVAFKRIVKDYDGDYIRERDRVVLSEPPCKVSDIRFIDYQDGMDLNDLSRFISFEIGGQKVLFTGDMTSLGVKNILSSKMAGEFRSFVKGTTVLKVPHHARENGCSQEMFDAFEGKPLLCIASDEVLNEKNEGTQAIDWYDERTSKSELMIDGILQDRKVFTTRKDKDIFLKVTDTGDISINTNYFGEKKKEILEGF